MHLYALCAKPRVDPGTPKSQNGSRMNEEMENPWSSATHNLSPWPEWLMSWFETTLPHLYWVSYLMWWKHNPSHFALIFFFSWGFWLKKRYGSGANDSVSDDPFSPTHISTPALVWSWRKGRRPRCDSLPLVSDAWGLRAEGWRRPLFQVKASVCPFPVLLP